MTTTTNEAATLPRAYLNRNIDQRLEQGDTYPFLATPDDGPTGYAGTLILPGGDDSLAGWAITAAAPPSLHPFIGHNGWWVTASEIRLDGTATVETVNTPDTSTEIVVGSRVRVTRDGDEPHNNGREAIVVGIGDGTETVVDLPAPYRVRYDNNEPGGVYGWWVNEVELLTVTPVSDYVPGQLVEVHGYGDGGESPWNGRAVIQRTDNTYVHVTLLDGGMTGASGAFEPIHVRPVIRPFEVGDRVVLVSPHVLNPGGMEYHESPDGVGSFGTLTRTDGDGTWGIDWEGGQGSSIHESCLRLANPRTPEPEPVVAEPALVAGQWFSWGSRAQWFRVERVEGNAIHCDRSKDAGGDPHPSTTVYSLDDMVRRHEFVAYHPTNPYAPEHIREQATGRDRMVPGNWYTWASANNWYLIDRVEDGDVYQSQRVRKSDGYLHEWSLSRNVDRLFARAGVLVVEPTSDLLPATVREGATPEPTPAPVVDPTAALRAELIALQDRYDSDLRTIQEIMREEAENRDWCSEYEQVADKINRNIHGTFESGRTRDWYVDFTGTVPVSFTGRVSVTLPYGADSDAIYEAAREALVAEGVRYNAEVDSGNVLWDEVDVDDDVSLDDFRSAD